MPSENTLETPLKNEAIALANAQLTSAGLRPVAYQVLEIKIKDVYGVATVYPANKVAEVFARIAGRKTLNADMLKAAAELGFQVKEQAPTVTLRGFY